MMEHRLNENEEMKEFDHTDFYQMYQEEMDGIVPCTAQEIEELSEELLNGSETAKKRLVEGCLAMASEIAEEYQNKGLSAGDLGQEANMALLVLASEYEGGNFRAQAEERIREALEEALEFQDTECRIEEEMLARVNVLKDISASMAEELGREATVEELAARMKMTEEEIKDIMKLTLDAMSVSGE